MTNPTAATLGTNIVVRGTDPAAIGLAVAQLEELRSALG